jgi:hypothetical protein
MTPRPTVPVFVTYRDRRTMLDRCIVSLAERGFDDITVIDNDSETPLKREEFGCPGLVCEIVRSDNSHRQLAPWALGLVPEDSWYIVMDGDIELDCPDDVASVLIHGLERNPSITKLGLSIRTDDFPWPLPERYWYSYLMEYACGNRNRFKILEGPDLEIDEMIDETVLISPGIIDAAVDTHFAMHRPGSTWGGINGARTLAPYLCRHLPWYNTEYSEEEKLYYARAGTKWTVDHAGETLLKPRIAVPFAQLRAETVVALHGEEVTYAPRTSDQSYYELLRDLWAEGRTFVIVEQDIVIAPDTIAELTACDHEWCAMAYPYRGEARAWGLACGKFSASLMSRFPDLMEEVGGMSDAKHPPGHWCRMDAWVWQALTSRGVSRCEHQATVGHIGAQYPSHGCLNAR